ncbi:hypothetical protein [Clostridium butyricum]|uniref:Immunoglobulin n=1 Tax=Clostridium butyricum TaxID=1492 RepID=A0A2S7FBG5_CLOBU|nr:hypothetical protein [Clostridium butyricum]KHD14012.1 hypothetical protein OA81_17370 [Clostridium butyricum]PPV15392.1 hypothetical protein AWN73_12160 [Clostridium butyricum]
MKLTKYEQETIVNYNAGEQTASVYTADKAVMRRFDRLVAEYPEQYQLVEQTEVSKTYSMPKSYVSYRKPRKISEVQREKARSKIEAINQAKNVVVN